MRRASFQRQQDPGVWTTYLLYFLVQTRVLSVTARPSTLNPEPETLCPRLLYLRLHGHAEQLLQKLLQARQAGSQGQEVVGTGQLCPEPLLLHPPVGSEGSRIHSALA